MRRLRRGGREGIDGRPLLPPADTVSPEGLVETKEPAWQRCIAARRVLSSLPFSLRQKCHDESDDNDTHEHVKQRVQQIILPLNEIMGILVKRRNPSLTIVPIVPHKCDMLRFGSRIFRFGVNLSMALYVNWSERDFSCPDTSPAMTN